MPITSPGNDDDTGENHQPTLRKNTAEPVEQTLKQNSYALPGPIVTADQAWQPAKGKDKGEALEGIRRRASQRNDMKGKEAATKTRGGHAR